MWVIPHIEVTMSHPVANLDACCHPLHQLERRIHYLTVT